MVQERGMPEGKKKTPIQKQEKIIWEKITQKIIFLVWVKGLLFDHTV
jgi:hypothetical protein